MSLQKYREKHLTYYENVRREARENRLREVNLCNYHRNEALSKLPSEYTGLSTEQLVHEIRSITTFSYRYYICFIIALIGLVVLSVWIAYAKPAIFSVSFAADMAGIFFISWVCELNRAAHYKLTLLSTHLGEMDGKLLLDDGGYTPQPLTA